MCHFDPDVATASTPGPMRGFVSSVEKYLVGCLTEPIDRIGTRPFDSNVTMACTRERWSGERYSLSFLETLKRLCQPNTGERQM